MAVPTTASVIGGGIAGVTAALLLAERGVRVTLFEREHHLGGRLGAWPKVLADGSRHVVEHGYHAFFRQYYNWRAVLRRIDPELGFLRPLNRYPIVSRRFPEENFAGLPGVPPLNLIALLRRSPSLRLRDLRRMDGRAALPLLSYDRRETYRRYDHVSAADFLDSLGLSTRARAMLFDVFAHSFFNPEAELSAAEMIMMFHFYFLRNPEGLDMDAPDSDYQTAIWGPLATHLAALGVDVRTGAPVDRVEPAGTGYAVTVRGGASIAADVVVLAADPAAARTIVAGSPGLTAAAPGLTAAAPGLAAGIATVETTAPYAVSRLWTDRDVAPSRAAFTGVSQEATLDSVTVYHRLERPSAQWARQTGGSVLEMHAYAAPDGPSAAELTHRMWGELGALWPETTAMSIVDVEEHVGRDAPAFGVGSDTTRPGVVTDAPGLFLAGDWVRMPFPTALMERSAASATIAANSILTARGARPGPILSVPPRGILAPGKPGAVADRRPD